jgi:hypothetical protein
MLEPITYSLILKSHGFLTSLLMISCAAIALQPNSLRSPPYKVMIAIDHLIDLTQLKTLPG